MSLRLYLLAILTTVVLVISALLSYQSVRFFFGGFDRFHSDLMLDIGTDYPTEGLIEQTVLGYHVTTDWSKVPEPVRNVFPQPPSEYGKRFTEYFDWIYIAPPQRAYSVMVLEKPTGLVYVSEYSEDIHQQIEADQQERGGWHIDPMLSLVILGFSTIFVFVFVLLTVFKRLAKPVESLQSWASKLTIAEVSQPVPDFKFKELNALAHLIRNNIASEAQAIKREQKFLSYASHELRTPIAVLRTNSTLLEKVNPEPSDKERKIRDRITRASLTMKSMTETLLWLSREETLDMPIEQVAIGQLLQEAEQELSYLLSGKQIEVTLTTDNTSVAAAKVPCQILINNLVRNAFQHTQQGQVAILHQDTQVVIHNIETELKSPDDQEQESLGFGLGMQLVEKLTQQFGWQINSEQLGNEFKVTIKFTA